MEKRPWAQLGAAHSRPVELAEFEALVRTHLAHVYT
eukprot:COSAG05_NODE_548_length_8749_cov_33.055838_6_plen_36_part_00